MRRNPALGDLARGRFHLLQERTDAGRARWNRSWHVNRGLIGLSSILIAWAFVVMMAVNGLSHLSSLPWPAS